LNVQFSEWEHVFKLDPAKEITDEQLEIVCESGTDAIMIGGTDNISLDNVLDLMYRVRQYAVPCVLEISTIDAITPGFDRYFVPTVFNSKEKKWVIDVQHEAIKQYHHLINWDDIVVEGYCILNPEAKAFQKTNCELPTLDDVVSYAQMAEHMFQLPIFYIEYSGTYGDPEIVKEVKQVLSKTKLFYGGGITTAEQAKEMKQFADTIVVGNSIYTHFSDALKTVKAVKKGE